MALIALAVGCSQSENSGPGAPGPGPRGPGALFTDTLRVTSHAPEQGAKQVDRATRITVSFASVIIEDCLENQDTWLRRTDDAAQIAGTFVITDQGRTVMFTPSQELDGETDYSFQMSALTCDTDGLLLEEEFRLKFRTYDATPPKIDKASVSSNSLGVNRYSNFTISFDEAVAASSITSTSISIRDDFGNDFSTDLSVNENEVQLDPCADLPGNRLLTITATTDVEDTAGNTLSDEWTVQFTTASDVQAPTVVSNWPPTLPITSPLIQPTIEFDESMDPNSVESANVQFTDSFANIVSYTTVASKDQKTLRLVPSTRLIEGRTYSITLIDGPGAVTDVTGNTLSNQAILSFIVGTDATPPALTESFPSTGTTGFSVNGLLTLSFDEALDPSRIDRTRITLSDGTKNTDIVVSSTKGDTEIEITPVENLTPSTSYTLTVKGGQDGLRDPAGNPLAVSQRLSFVAADDPSLPKLILLPANGTVSVPTGVELRAFSATPLMANTVSTNTVLVTDAAGSAVQGTLTLTRDDRVISFDPNHAWNQGTWYKMIILSGPNGLRNASGNWMSQDVVSSFRIGYSGDFLVPEVTVTLNEIDKLRNENLSVPPYGFKINVSARDFTHYSLDMSSVQVELSGPGSVPSTEAIFADATLDGSTLSYTLGINHKLSPGTYTVTAKVSDLSGNVGGSGVYDFVVHDPEPAVIPFERTQVVWLRTDLDRDQSGTPDFEEDLLRLGLISAGDPAGTNARMIQVMRDAIAAQSYKLFERKQNGGREAEGSVAIRFSFHEPRGLQSMHIALGGFDPQGPKSRKYGDESTGTLGRAFFDYRNGTMADRNTATNPGLGVFPGELFLFESRVHIQVFPSFVTSFAKRFAPIAPAMGGMPAGSHSSDAVALAEGFNYSLGTSAQRGRYNTIFQAADDWAVAIGTILAHEIGHTVGLVARNKNPSGLHGDSSLHNEFSSVSDVMSAAVGYDSLISLDYEFRDLNIAYLRHRVLLK